MRKSDGVETNISLRKEQFPDLNTEDLWIERRGQSKSGYSMIPRPMPGIFKIMDSLSPPGQPISSTYFALWCTDRYSTSFLKIDNPSIYALESGFSHSRKEYTWRKRMEILEEYGFIKSKAGRHGEFSYVLIINPFVVIKDLYEKKLVDKEFYIDLIYRAGEFQSDELGILKEAVLPAKTQPQEIPPENSEKPDPTRQEPTEQGISADNMAGGS